MERKKIINDLKEWQGKDEENRAFILIISGQSDEDKTEGYVAVQGNKQIIGASLAATIIEKTELFEDALRILSPSIFKEVVETDKDTNADIN